MNVLPLQLSRLNFLNTDFYLLIVKHIPKVNKYVFIKLLFGFMPRHWHTVKAERAETCRCGLKNGEFLLFLYEDLQALC